MAHPMFRAAGIEYNCTGKGQSIYVHIYFFHKLNKLLIEYIIYSLYIIAIKNSILVN
jgi:hypothetical protein